MTSRAIIGAAYEIEDPKYFIEQVKADYKCGQLEKCPKTGKLLVQFFAWSKNPQRWSELTKKHHCERPRDQVKSLDYCMKDDTRVDGPWEFGQRPTFNKKGEKEKLSNKMLLKNDFYERKNTIFEENNNESDEEVHHWGDKKRKIARPLEDFENKSKEDKEDEKINDHELPTITLNFDNDENVRGKPFQVY